MNQTLKITLKRIRTGGDRDLHKGFDPARQEISLEMSASGPVVLPGEGADHQSFLIRPIQEYLAASFAVKHGQGA